MYKNSIMRAAVCLMDGGAGAVFDRSSCEQRGKELHVGTGGLLSDQTWPGPGAWKLTSLGSGPRGAVVSASTWISIDLSHKQ